jgi:LPS sulfotransferase NodH
MHLPHRFYKFPLRFDVERLRAELAAIPEEAWRFHPQNFNGNSALPLIATYGDIESDGFEPPMEPTEYLLQSPYIQQVLGEFKTVLGRARFMRLEPGSGVPLHFDIRYYWRTHCRVHIPVITDPAIRFHCETENVHMAEGEAWTFDNWRNHWVVNETPVRRVHLTFDTFGSNEFWDMAKPLGGESPARLVPFKRNAQAQLMLETYMGDPVMHPAELDEEFRRLVADLEAVPENDPAQIAFVRNLTGSIGREWRLVWHAYGPEGRGLERFMALAQCGKDAVASISKDLLLASNGRPLTSALPATFDAMIAPTAAAQFRMDKLASPGLRKAGPRFEKPIFIVAAPRSGSTLLFETLSANEAFWTLGGEGHQHVERIAALNPRSRDFDSNRLTKNDADEAAVEELCANYLAGLRKGKQMYTDMRGAPRSVRFLEKTPKNALRIPFFKAMFPDAKFIFLHREPRANMSAIIEAWRSGRFVTYKDLPGWSGPPWSLLLIPGWRELAGRNLGEIAMRQWRDTNAVILGDLEALPGSDWCAVAYEDFLADPGAELMRLCAFAGVPFDAEMQKIVSRPLKPSRYTLTPPDPQKWRKNEALIVPYLGATRAMAERLEALAAEEFAAIVPAG